MQVAIITTVKAQCHYWNAKMIDKVMPWILGALAIAATLSLIVGVLLSENEIKHWDDERKCEGQDND